MSTRTPNALVVHESQFGNTARIAAAIVAGLTAEGYVVDTVDVAQPRATALTTYDLVVVGGPTHAFSLTRANTRAEAVRQGAPSYDGPGLREWIEATPTADADAPPVLVFDTRVSKVRRLPKSAATRATTLLRRKGYRMFDRPTGFVVDDVAGPLLDGEEARANAWARRLGHDVVRDLEAHTHAQTGETDA
jgi:hypothetical protein